ncbi:DUF1482 family protein [Salmonella enterica subsp. enterica]|nr:DUF1482 family protein [Salmonella enterica]EIZ8586810.1 DUF1482 family protein [Salmonella enterica subsp. enterica]
MKTTLLAVFAWAIVVHAIHNGEPVDAVIDVFDTHTQCIQEMEAQNINGECFEVESIHHVQPS